MLRVAADVAVVAVAGVVAAVVIVHLLLVVFGCWLFLVVGCFWLLFLVVVVFGCFWLFLVVVVVVSETTEARQCVYPQSPVLIGMGSPRWQRTLQHRGLQKLALNSGTTRRSVKNASVPPKNPSHSHMTASRSNVQIFKCELREEPGQPTR